MGKIVGLIFDNTPMEKEKNSKKDKKTQEVSEVNTPAEGEKTNGEIQK